MIECIKFVTYYVRLVPQYVVRTYSYESKEKKTSKTVCTRTAALEVVSIRMQGNDVNDDVTVLTLSRATYGDTVLQ